MKIITIIILIMILLGIGYMGLSVWSSCQGPNTSTPDMPDSTEATHEFYIENTGGLIFASDFEQHGEKVGSRIFNLHGFWEMRGKDFKFVQGDIILDENIFGEIIVKRRVK